MYEGFEISNSRRERLGYGKWAEDVRFATYHPSRKYTAEYST